MACCVRLIGLDFSWEEEAQFACCMSWVCRCALQFGVSGFLAGCLFMFLPNAARLSPGVTRRTFHTSPGLRVLPSGGGRRDNGPVCCFVQGVCQYPLVTSKNSASHLHAAASVRICRVAAYLESTGAPDVRMTSMSGPLLSTQVVL